MYKIVFDKLLYLILFHFWQTFYFDKNVQNILFWIFNFVNFNSRAEKTTKRIQSQILNFETHFFCLDVTQFFRTLSTIYNFSHTHYRHRLFLHTWYQMMIQIYILLIHMEQIFFWQYDNSYQEVKHVKVYKEHLLI